MKKNPTKPRAAAATSRLPDASASHLPDELVEFGILSRLPSKSLIRFMSVSKKWHFIVSTPHPLFAHLQSQRAASCLLAVAHDRVQTIPTNPNMSTSLTVYASSPDPTSIDIQIFGKHMKRILKTSVCYNIVASCNGILCCSNTPGVHHTMVVGNPALNNWRTIPAIPYRRYYYGLAVDVGESSAMYQLVLLTYLCYDAYEVHIFSSATQSWRMSKERVKPVEGDFPRDAVYAKGYLYWKFKHDCRLLWINMETELNGLQAPPPGAENPDLGNIGECGGQLCYAFIKDGVVQMWYWDHLHWYKRLSIALDNIVGGVLEAEVSMMPFQGEDCLSVSVGNFVYCFDALARVIHKQAKPHSFHYFLPYKDTIVSLLSEEEEQKKR